MNSLVKYHHTIKHEKLLYRYCKNQKQTAQHTTLMLIGSRIFTVKNYNGIDEDGEYVAENKLLKHLKDNNFDNVLVVVSRHAGKKLGPKRFIHMINAGNKPYLFILSAEIMANMFRHYSDITGIEIGKIQMSFTIRRRHMYILRWHGNI